MKPSTLAYYARRPVFTIRRALYKIYEWRHPEEPWISQGSVKFCDQHLTKQMRGVEWGSGRSTAWYAERLGHLTSIEHHKEWFDHVTKKLKDQGIKNVDYRHIPLEHPIDQPTSLHYDPMPNYVSAIDEFGDQSIDFFVVDGHYRQACIQRAIPKLRSGGYLLVDNTNWLPLEQWYVPSNWPMVHQSENVMSETTIWQKP